MFAEMAAYLHLPTSWPRIASNHEQPVRFLFAADALAIQHTVTKNGGTSVRRRFAHIEANNRINSIAPVSRPRPGSSRRIGSKNWYNQSRFLRGPLQLSDGRTSEFPLYSEDWSHATSATWDEMLPSIPDCYRSRAT
jgi:hypothetical protein